MRHIIGIVSISIVQVGENKQFYPPKKSYFG